MWKSAAISTASMAEQSLRPPEPWLLLGQNLEVAALDPIEHSRRGQPLVADVDGAQHLVQNELLFPGVEASAHKYILKFKGML
jgi:hypothetical protein